MDIKIQNLKKIYNGNTVLDIDNLGVAKGELIGLVGNNGAGKTTLLRLILDLIQADDGFVESNGQKVNESETWKEYTGSYIDGRFLIDFLTPEEYFDFIADVYHIDDETLQERLAQFEALCTMKSWELRSISVIFLRQPPKDWYHRSNDY